jgi:hypothetical protein
MSKISMTRRCASIIAGLISLGSLTSCVPIHSVSVTEIVQPQAADIYTHLPSHHQFPPKVGGFKREDVAHFMVPAVKQYDRQGNDISVGYDNFGQDIVLTVFVYPVPQRGPDSTLAGHYGNCKLPVLQHEGARLVSEEEVEIAPAGQRHEGKHATFAFTGIFEGKRQALGSELYVFTHDRWFVMFRATYPVDHQAAAGSLVRGFVDALAWP